MLPGFEKIVEERIRTAQNKGVFDNLPGTGKPLPKDSGAMVPEELKLAYKILKNGDCLPQEIELKKEIQKTEDLLADMPDCQERYHTIKKLNFLIMKFNDIRKASVNFDVPQHYEGKLLDRINNKPEKKNTHVNR